MAENPFIRPNTKNLTPFLSDRNIGGDRVVCRPTTNTSPAWTVQLNGSEIVEIIDAPVSREVTSDNVEITFYNQGDKVRFRMTSKVVS